MVSINHIMKYKLCMCRLHKVILKTEDITTDFEMCTYIHMYIHESLGRHGGRDGLRYTDKGSRVKMPSSASYSYRAEKREDLIICQPSMVDLHHLRVVLHTQIWKVGGSI